MSLHITSMTHAALPAGPRTGGRLFEVHCRGRQEGGNLSHFEPLFYPSSRNYQSCERHNTYILKYNMNIFIYIYKYIHSWSRYFLSFASLEALIANLARDAWGLPRPRIGSCPLGTKRLDIVSVRLCLCVVRFASNPRLHCQRLHVFQVVRNPLPLGAGACATVDPWGARRTPQEGIDLQYEEFLSEARLML